MYEFTSECLTGVDEIDNEHRRLFQIINETIALSTEGSVSPKTLLKSLLKQLKQYAATHFEHEESYMEKIRDSELSRQRREHRSFVEKIEEFEKVELSEEQAKDTLPEVVSYLVRWLYRHILSSDIMIGHMPKAEEDVTDAFEFTDKYITGVDFIDEEHRYLFDIIGETNDVIHAEYLHDKYDQIMHLLTRLKDYTVFHFGDEEKYMEQIGYPEIRAQQRAHAIFIEKLVDISQADLEKMDDNQEDYLVELIQFLLSWLTNHILKMDKQIGIYVTRLQQGK